MCIRDSPTIEQDQKDNPPRPTQEPKVSESIAETPPEPIEQEEPYAADQKPIDELKDHEPKNTSNGKHSNGMPDNTESVDREGASIHDLSEEEPGEGVSHIGIGMIGMIMSDDHD